MRRRVRLALAVLRQQELRLVRLVPDRPHASPARRSAGPARSRTAPNSLRARPRQVALLALVAHLGTGPVGVSITLMPLRLGALHAAVEPRPRPARVGVGIGGVELRLLLASWAAARSSASRRAGGSASRRSALISVQRRVDARVVEQLGGASKLMTWRGDAWAATGTASRPSRASDDQSVSHESGAPEPVTCGPGCGNQGTVRGDDGHRRTPREQAAALDLPPLLVRRPLEAFLDAQGLGAGAARGRAGRRGPLERHVPRPPRRRRVGAAPPAAPAAAAVGPRRAARGAPARRRRRTPTCARRACSPPATTRPSSARRSTSWSAWRATS